MIALSGDYRSKKEVAYALVPAIGRRILDLGGNVEKGDSILRSRAHSYLPKIFRTSTDLQTHRQLFGPWFYRADF